MAVWRAVCIFSIFRLIAQYNIVRYINIKYCGDAAAVRVRRISCSIRRVGNPILRKHNYAHNVKCIHFIIILLSLLYTSYVRVLWRKKYIYIKTAHCEITDKYYTYNNVLRLAFRATSAIIIITLFSLTFCVCLHNSSLLAVHIIITAYRYDTNKNCTNLIRRNARRSPDIAFYRAHCVTCKIGNITTSCNS